MSKKPAPTNKTASKVERANTGKRGAKKNPQTVLNNVLLGKGMHAKVPPYKGLVWKGTEVIGTLFDREQSEKNKALGYW